jgi:hypothetical protein
MGNNTEMYLKQGGMIMWTRFIWLSIGSKGWVHVNTAINICVL